MICDHPMIRVWRDAETGASAGMWSCYYCHEKFVPITQLFSERECDEQRIADLLEQEEK